MVRVLFNFSRHPTPLVVEVSEKALVSQWADFAGEFEYSVIVMIYTWLR